MKKNVEFPAAIVAAGLVGLSVASCGLDMDPIVHYERDIEVSVEGLDDPDELFLGHKKGNRLDVESSHVDSLYLDGEKFKYEDFESYRDSMVDISKPHRFHFYCSSQTGKPEVRVYFQHFRVTPTGEEDDTVTFHLREWVGGVAVTDTARRLSSVPWKYWHREDQEAEFFLK